MLTAFSIIFIKNAPLKMNKPKLSKHFENRMPSSIRSAQILFSDRKDKKNINVINLSIGNISLPMFPAMKKKMAQLGLKLLGQIYLCKKNLSLWYPRLKQTLLIPDKKQMQLSKQPQSKLWDQKFLTLVLIMEV